MNSRNIARCLSELPSCYTGTNDTSGLISIAKRPRTRSHSKRSLVALLNEQTEGFNAVVENGKQLSNRSMRYVRELSALHAEQKCYLRLHLG